jgi:Holliday junction resolvase RusA-like endonuclease
MDSAITFTIPGQPVAKGRPRSFVRGGHVAHYTPDKTARYENLVKLAGQQAMNGRPPMEGPVSLTVHAYFAIPASWSRKKQAAAYGGSITPTSRPDLDNVVKSIKDGLNGVAWRDDSQVVTLAAIKRYCATPGVAVTVGMA